MWLSCRVVGHQLSFSSSICSMLMDSSSIEIYFSDCRRIYFCYNSTFDRFGKVQINTNRQNSRFTGIGKEQNGMRSTIKMCIQVKCKYNSHRQSLMRWRWCHRNFSQYFSFVSPSSSCSLQIFRYRKWPKVYFAFLLVLCRFQWWPFTALPDLAVAAGLLIYSRWAYQHSCQTINHFREKVFFS